MLSIRFAPRANLDYAEAINWYSNHDPMTAERLDLAIQQAVDQVQNDPLRWPLIDELHRRANIKGFPYSIIYRIVEEIILVVAIAHSSRDADYWRMN